MARRQFKSILVAIEFPRERRQAGLARAAQLARRLGARLVLFHCAYSPQSFRTPFLPTEYGGGIERMLADLHAGLERLAQPLRRRGLKVSVRVVWDYPAFEAIVREVLHSQPDLVVAETRRHKFGARLFLGNADWQLIRFCPAPLLLVRNSRPYGRARVLAAVDPLHARARSLHLDERILEAAQAIASAHAGRLDVIHAHMPLSTIVAAGAGEAVVIPVDPRVESRHTRAVRRAVDRIVAPLRLPEGRLHVEIGGPEILIVDMAKSLRADVVVMGAVSRRGLERAFIGNTAERIVDRLPCDVLVVKPPRFRTPILRRRAPGRRLIPAI